MRKEFEIDHHRFLELKHFCLQYNNWKSIYQEIDGSPMLKFSREKKSEKLFDSTISAVERREEYLQKIELVEKAAELADADLKDYLICAVTTGVSYYGLRCYNRMPACKEKYYSAYRRFFFILDKTRK